MSDSKIQGLLDRLEKIKGEIADHFERVGLGKDALLRVHGALDEAHAAIASHRPVEGHDLNVDLAESPEDHPAPQGQVSTPINRDDNVNQGTPDGDVEHVVSGAPQDAKSDAKDDKKS